MATYTEITETKYIDIESDGGTKTLTYYAGNKNKTTGSVVGNVDKKDITYYFDTTTSWVNTVTFTNRDETAKNITVDIAKNNSTSSRSVTLKLKDQTSDKYLVITQSARAHTPSTPTVTWEISSFCIALVPEGHNDYITVSTINSKMPLGIKLETSKTYLVISSSSKVGFSNTTTYSADDDHDDFGDELDNIPSYFPIPSSALVYSVYWSGVHTKNPDETCPDHIVWQGTMQNGTSIYILLDY